MMTRYMCDTLSAKGFSKRFAPETYVLSPLFVSLTSTSRLSLLLPCNVRWKNDNSSATSALLLLIPPPLLLLLLLLPCLCSLSLHGRGPCAIVMRTRTSPPSTPLRESQRSYCSTKQQQQQRQQQREWVDSSGIGFAAINTTRKQQQQE